MNVQGKTALVTGASRGIGRAIALELARQGMKRLLLLARDRQRLEQVATEIEAIGAEAVTLAVDLTLPVEVNIAIANVWKLHGPIHLLVNCAGVAHQAPFLQSKLPQVQEEVSLNFMGMYSITHLVARRMASQQGGTIVNVSSLMGKVAAPTMSTYSATKFAILGFTQALRRELAPYNIKVIALLPTLTDTDMVVSHSPSNSLKSSPSYFQLYPFRMACPELSPGSTGIVKHKKHSRRLSHRDTLFLIPFFYLQYFSIPYIPILSHILHPLANMRCTPPIAPRAVFYATFCNICSTSCRNRKKWR